MKKYLITLVLALTTITTACTDAWVKVALADLPVLIQMALNIAGLVSTIQSGTPPSTAETAAIQNLGAQANKDLSAIDNFYIAYKQNPSPSTLAAIENAINTTNLQLPALLAAANIKDPVLLARVTAAVSLITTTVDSFAALIPQATPTKSARLKAKPLTPAQLKNLWNLSVCPQGNTCKL